MLTEPHRFRIEPDSELSRFLDEAGVTPILLEKNGKLYRLIEESADDIWAGYEPERAEAALKEAVATWADVDTDKVIDAIYRAREEGSRPITRP